MKQKFTLVICAIIIAFTFISTSVNAQTSLTAGTYPGASESLLGVRYRKLNLGTSASETGAIYTGIPDLNTNRSNSRSESTLSYSTSGTFNFTITYNTIANTLTTETTIGATTVSTVLSNVSGRLSSDGKTATATSINLVTLAVKSHHNNTISVSDITIDGVPVTGTYTRSNSMGTSNWHLSSSSLTDGFVVTGTVTMSGTMGMGQETQLVEMNFANSPTAPGSSLPIVWGGFASKRINSSSISLVWRTIQELNASHYNVQRSEDGIRFSTIGIVMAQGTTAAITDYAFDDKNATGSMYYYRLQQVDLDASINYSAIIKQGNGGKQTLVGGLGSSKIVVQFFSNDTRNIRIVNNSGLIVKQLNSTTQQQVLDVNNLPVGVYALQIINSDGTSEVHRFVK
jgi:hypothetical protein